MKKIFLRSLLLVLCLLAFTSLKETALAAESSAKTPAVTPNPDYKNTLVQIQGKTYYFNAKGNPVKKKWKTIGGKLYYFTKDGSAAAGWQLIDGKRYWFHKKGAARTGWCTRGKKTYYFSKKDAAALTGWHKIGGKKYYFDSDGVLATSQWIDDRYVNKKGVYNPDKKLPLLKLKSQLQSAIRSYSGVWSVYVKDLDTNQSISINNRSMYAASLIKLYAMGAAYERIQQGKLKESAVYGTISDMITVSDNSAFNTIVRSVGTTYVNTWCEQNGYLDTNQGHGLSPSYNNYGLTNGSGSNMTSVLDCGRFLESVYRGTCVNKSSSAKMLNFLKQQTRRSKIPAGVPGNVTVANKTGETDDYTHDAAIVYSKGSTYIIAVMAYTPGEGWYSARHIPTLSSIVYNYFN